MFAASEWPKTPNTPHSSWNLSSSIGSLRTFSCTRVSTRERGNEAYRAGTFPATMPEHAAPPRTSGQRTVPGAALGLPGRQPFARAGQRLASAHGGREGGADRRGAHEAARAVPAAHAGHPFRLRLEAPRIGSAEPPWNAQAARRPDRDQGM